MLYWTTPTRPSAGVILHGGGGWKDSQVNDPVIVVDPADSSQLLMFYMGEAAPVMTGDAAIGRATAPVSDPFTWTEYAGNPVINPANSIRPCAAIVVGSSIYLFVLEYAAPNKIVRYTSTDSGITWGSKIDCLTLTGQGRDDGYALENCAVIKEGSAWTMIYCCLSTSTAFSTRYRYATSSDGATWTKGGSGDLLTCGPNGAPDYFGMEWCALCKVDEHYILMYEAATSVSPYESPGSTTTYSLNVAHSTSLPGGWRKSEINPVWYKSDIVGRFDRYHVSTGAFYQIGGTWYIFHCGGLDAEQHNFDIAIATMTGDPTQCFVDSCEGAMSANGLPLFEG